MSDDNNGIVKFPRPKEILDLSYYNTTEEKVKQAHDNWSATYEQDMLEVCKYQTPDLIVPVFQEGVEEVFSMLKRNALSLLDVGAGTGILGERLSATGFTNLQAIDLAPKMLAIAEKKRLYKRIVCDSLYNWQKHFDAGQFEAALGCGIFTPGQLKPSAVDEIISLVKPGGIMVMSIRQDALDSLEYGYQSKFSELQESGILRLMKKELIRRYADVEATRYTNPYGYIIMHQVVKHH